MTISTAADGAAPAEKPAVLIVGGLGYVGRFLALYIHKNNLASELRLVDKQLPELASLAPEFKEVCSRPRFQQADASREQHLPRIFDRANGQPFDIVVNCAGETRLSQDDAVYAARAHAPALALGREAARRRVRCFVECSTGMVYKPGRSTPRDERARLEPWSRLAEWKLRAERDLAEVPGLNLLVLRMANVYGPYMARFLGTALALARVYQSERAEMRFLWDRDLKTHTVHVEDAARAVFEAATWYLSRRERGDTAPVFNVVDSGDCSQGTLASIINDIFGIPTAFQGTLMSQLAKLHLDAVVDDMNDDTLDPWADLQAEAGTDPNSPLNPFLEKELLKDADLCMDGALFTRTTGFQYKHPRINKEEVEDVIESYRRMNWWP